MSPVQTAAPPLVHPMRILMLHSFRTSGAIFQEQVRRSGLHKPLNEVADLVGALASVAPASVASVLQHSRVATSGVWKAGAIQSLFRP